eukprot:gnl/Dysnectes_brevis/4248_a5625_409.p1 GENE.gnl/Dysnectes_brevis/4248_a5625_409~~gnl/Dysnectes_brevis/4248_a5625_409.p1  ORF type:complete len:248 (+),score=31.66 gnl/Dysnectes_brevis/4248_a5625_409:26-769(+)
MDIQSSLGMQSTLEGVYSNLRREIAELDVDIDNMMTLSSKYGKDSFKDSLQYLIRTKQRKQRKTEEITRKLSEMKDNIRNTQSFLSTITDQRVSDSIITQKASRGSMMPTSLPQSVVRGAPPSHPRDHAHLSSSRPSSRSPPTQHQHRSMTATHVPPVEMVQSFIPTPMAPTGGGVSHGLSAAHAHAATPARSGLPGGADPSGRRVATGAHAPFHPRISPASSGHVAVQSGVGQVLIYSPILAARRR